MKFGKLPDISNVNFKLPAVNDKNIELLKSYNNTSTTIYVGCTGWSMKEWVGKVYPRKTKSQDYFKHYTKQFNTIELNTTHYRIPDKATVETWRFESANDFRFCPKILQAISHRNAMGAGGLLDDFCNAIAMLKEKMGCCFIQLPPYFGADKLAQLENFLKRFPKEIPLAVEVRHESWFANEAHSESLFSLLKKYNKSAVITDVAGRRDVCHMRLANDIAMVRFVGNNLHPTDYQRIDAWVERIKVWSAAGLRELYFFPHEPDNLLAPDLSLYLVDQLKKHVDAEVRGPKFYQNEDQQMSLF